MTSGAWSAPRQQGLIVRCDCRPRCNTTGVCSVRRRERRIERRGGVVFRSGGRAGLPEDRQPDPPSSVEVGVVGRSHPRFYWSNRAFRGRLAPPTLSPCVSLWPPPPARRSNRAYRPGPRPLCPESRRPPRPPTCARRHLSRPAYASIPARRRSAACRVPRTPGSGWRRRSTARPRPAPAGASGPVSMLRTGPPHRSGTLATKPGPPYADRAALAVNGRLRHTVEGASRRAPPCVVFRVGFSVLQTSSAWASAVRRTRRAGRAVRTRAGCPASSYSTARRNARA